MERECSPLTPHCARALSDKLYEKRKAASMEIEKSTREFISRGNVGAIRKMLKVLAIDFALTPNPNSRKGGLLGISAVAIQLKTRCPEFLEDMITPVLACLSDPDHRVKYHACESLYNIVKVARGGCLPHFEQIFDALARLATDPEASVRSGAEALDRLMKDIVSESPAFDLVAFMNMLRERIMVQNTAARQFLVGWISAMNSMPDINMMVFLPDILHGVFEILADPALQRNCQSTLDSFLETIKKNPQETRFTDMTAILIDHSQSNVEVVQLTALVWIEQFVILSGRTILPHTSGILMAVLPTLDNRYALHNETFKEISRCAMNINEKVLELVATEAEVKDGGLLPDLRSVIAALSNFLDHPSTRTRMAVLRWILHLYRKLPAGVQEHMDTVLSDEADQVVLLNLEVLSEISKKESGSQTNKDYFQQFVNSLLELFRNDQKLLERRGSFIIRQLCVLLPAEDIYRSMGTLLEQEDDLRFSEHMVKTLNTILLTTSELFPLRNSLKDLNTDERRKLFVCLYRVWCHHPLAAVSLCLLSQHYAHACELLQRFADVEVTADFLVEVDKLIQLIESPIFTFLRLQLLEPEKNRELVKALYGLLMLLPQSEAFLLLRTRLMCIPTHHLPPLNEQRERESTDRTIANGPKSETRASSQVDFGELLGIFEEIQRRKREREARRQKHKLSHKNLILQQQQGDE
ncbi:protein VAC14 homolog isoform X2 [Varroa destructor]|uniref:Protein VAC14 homolog n=1 Tax=Varroa destructor TaxID=109461 RepID=A0A7M7JX87_VARDE|nr:protein VAC14 homolog isoform X2 [Varroa destructor]